MMYDVFLSFRGEEIRKTFLSHLLCSLDRKGIKSVTSAASYPLEIQAFMESVIAISVISKNYYTSLDLWVEELGRMISCNKKIVPIFLRVDPLDVLRLLRLAEDSTKNAPRRLNMMQLTKWLDSHLQNESGFNSSDWEDDSQLVDKITCFISDEVKKISIPRPSDHHPSLDWVRNPEEPESISELYSMEDCREDSLGRTSYVSIKSSWWDGVSRKIPFVHRSRPSEVIESLGWGKYIRKNPFVKHRKPWKTIHSSMNQASYCDLLGMKRRAKEVLSMLQGDSTKEVVTIGIYGMPGVGKTTLARYVYDEVSQQFQYHFFMSNFSSKFKPQGSSSTPSLLEILASEFLNTRTSFRERSSDVHREMVGHRKVLFVADSVDDIEQLKGVVKEGSLFGSGSRVIVITQNRSLLVQCGVKQIFEVMSPRYEEAIQIFSHFAFKQSDPRHGFDLLSLRAVQVAGRIPLALKVLGSFLYGRDIDEWKSILNRLEASHDNNTAEFYRYINERVRMTSQIDVPTYWSMGKISQIVSHYATSLFNDR